VHVNGDRAQRGSGKVIMTSPVLHAKRLSVMATALNGSRTSM
jgi:hypothetical protein